MVSQKARALHVKPDVLDEYEQWSRETMKVRKTYFLDNYQLLSTIRRELLAGQALVMRGTRTRRATIGLYGPRTASPIGQF